MSEKATDTSQAPPRPSAGTRGPLAVALIYAATGSLWIVISDAAVESLLADSASALAIQTAKDLLFIGVTTLLVYLLARWALRGRESREAERRLEAAETLLETVLASQTDAVLLIDPATRTMVRCNHAAERIFGYRREELIGRSTELLHADHDSFVRFGELSRPTLDRGRPFRIEFRMRRKDGEVIDTEHTVLAMTGAGDWRGGVVSVVRDLTARRRAERALADSEAALRTTVTKLDELIEGIPDLVFLKDRELRYERLNRAGAAFVAREREQLIGRTDHDLFEPDQAARIVRADREVLADDRSRTYEETVIDSQGRERHLLTTKGPLHDDAGRVQGLYGISRDVTEFWTIQTALEERMKELRTLYEVTRVLAQADVALEERLASLVRLLPAGWLEPELTEARIRFGERTFATEGFRETPWTLSSPIRRGETELGRIEIALTRERPERGEGPFLSEERALLDGLARAVGEAAERERLERLSLQSQQLESVGRLAGGIAHDFNNMMSVVLGSAELALLKLDPDSEAHRLVGEIHEAGRRASSLTRQLLAFARRQSITPTALDLDRTIERMLQMLRVLAGEDVEVEWRPGAAREKVKVDPGQLDQVLTNLVANARDAIDGVGRITVSTERVELDEDTVGRFDGGSPGTYLRLAVRDDGAGMDAETRARLFEPFFTTKPLLMGTGLGLATVYGIVKQNDGLIEVESDPGRGSTFSIYLPLTAEQETAAPTTVEHPEPPPGRETILLVEDEPALLRMTAQFLQRLGYTVLPASGPREAIRLVEEGGSREIRLLLTDVVMPEMNGRDLYQRLLELRPGLDCLYCSGYTADVIARRGVLEDDVHFLQKPFTLAQLAAKLREVLAG